MGGGTLRPRWAVGVVARHRVGGRGAARRLLVFTIPVADRGETGADGSHERKKNTIDDTPPQCVHCHEGPWIGYSSGCAGGGSDGRGTGSGVGLDDPDDWAPRMPRPGRRQAVGER